MNIHTPTIIALIAISNVLNIIIFLLQYFINKKSKGIVSWIFAFLMIAVSQLILLADITYQIVIANVIADILLVSGFIFITVGLQQFLEIKIKVKLLASIFTLVFFSAIAYYFHRNEIIEEAISFLCLGSVSFIISSDLYKRHKAERNYSKLLISILFIVYFILFTLQSVIDLTQIHKPFNPNFALLPVIYILSFIMSTLSAFSFVMLLNQQLVAQRQKAADRLQISETNYRNDFLFLQSILESPQDIIIFSLDTNYCYTAFTSYHKAVMKKIWGADIYKGLNMLEFITNPDDRTKAKENFDKALKGNSFAIEEAYGNENMYRTYFENRYSPIKNVAGVTIGISVFVIDITERRKAEQEAQEVKNHFETLFKISPDAALVSSLPEGKIIDVNDAFETASGFSRKEAINSTVLELGFWANPLDRNTFFEAISSKGFCKNLEVVFIVKDGTKKTFLLSAKVYTVNGIPLLISIIHDITERKKAEEALYLNKYAITHTSDAVFWVKEDGSFFELNDTACAVMGYQKEELMKLSVMNIDPNFNVGIWNAHWAELKEKRHLTIISSHIKKDGVIIETEVNANYINFNGVELNCAFVRDITERRKEEENKEKTRLNYEALINSTNDLMWSVDKDFNLITGNSAFINKMVVYADQQLKPGDPLLIKDKFDDSYLQYWKDMYETVLAGKPIHTQIQAPDTEHTELRWEEFYLNPIYNGDIITGVACFGENITERKLQEAIVKDLNKQIKLRADEMAASNKDLEEFAYIASHDLQEPLRMVSSFLQLLEKKYNHQLDEKGLQYIKFAVDGAARMRQIILDLLEYSRVGKGKQLAEPINMNKLLEDVVQLNSVAIKESNATVEWNQLPDISCVKLSIQQLFQNLISNALKYHQPGINPVIKINATEIEHYWQIEVADNGIGIDPAFHDKIFVVFQRLHGKGKYAGNGIGLSICKKIIEREGGKIWVTSEPGKGSIFFFTIKK